MDFDGSGYEIEVARFQKKQIEVQIGYLKRFLAATQLNLAVYFDVVRYSNLALDEVPVSERTVENLDHWSCVIV